MTKKEFVEDYTGRISNNINDALYAQGLSWEGKIKSLRTYAEIILRFVLGDEKCHLTLGDKQIQERLLSVSSVADYLIAAVDKVNSFGNDNVHTYKVSVATEKDFYDALDAVYDMYSFLFIDFFTKNGVSTNNRILGIFSMLPPIIRKKVLEYLWKKDTGNITIIDKLCLAILKADGKAAAYTWINTNQELLKQLPCRTAEAAKDLISKIGPKVAFDMFASEPQNMYELCLDKVDSLSVTIEKNGPLYSTYEEALCYYENIMATRYQKLAPQEREFVVLMDFCFKGRIPFDNGKEQRLYSIGNVRTVI